MTTLIEAAKSALEVLHYLEALNKDISRQKIEVIVALRSAIREAEKAEPVASKDWENAEYWMPLAWQLCAKECGEEACNELIWEGGPIPEPWGDRWLKYEAEAKRLIALVQNHTTPPAQPAVKDELTWLDNVTLVFNSGYIRGNLDTVNGEYQEPTSDEITTKHRDEMEIGFAKFPLPKEGATNV
jgi:hypothetical protein